MPSRDQDYSLIAVLHDQLEDIESYNRYLKSASDCEACARIWTTLKAQAEEAVAMIRAEIQRHAVD
ncbi:MAG: hypothetical protein U0893_11020 [Chloroflexota bacterium]